jgi:hypothetical protein
MPILLWFQDLPAAPALGLICCYYVGFGVMLTWLGRFVSKELRFPRCPPGLGPALGMIGTMASILIGLVIVALWNDYRVARATVSSEATEVRGAARDIQLMAPASRDLLLNDLRRYVVAVTNDEWPAMRHGTYATGAGRALARLALDANGARTDGFDLQARVGRIGELRTTRLSQTTTGVVAVLWFALLTIPVIMFAGLGLMNDESAGFHYIIVGLVAVATSIAIFVTIEIDLPYRGVVALSPAPIARAIDQAVTESTPDTQ